MLGIPISASSRQSRDGPSNSIRAALLGAHRIRAAIALAIGLQLAPGSLPAQAHSTAPSPAIERLHARVLAVSPYLATQRAAITVAEARRGLAGLGQPITVEGEIEELPRGIDLARAEQINLAVSRELVPRARRAGERGLADQAIARARLELEVLEQALVIQADRLVSTSAGAAAIAARYAAEDSLVASAEDAVRSRFAVGDARFVDVLRLRTERLRIQTEMHRARSEHRIARGMLLRLAGGSTRTSRAVTADGIADTSGVVIVEAALADEARRAVSALPPSPDMDTLLAGSGAIRLAAQDVARARAAQTLSRTSLQPTVTPRLGIQRFARDAGFTVGPMLGLSIGLPRTASGRGTAEARIAASELALSEATVRSTTERVAASLGAAADRYEAARLRIASFDATLLRGATQEREAALASYRSGGLTLLELLDFERALAQAEITRMQSRIDAIDARADLLLAALGADDLSALTGTGGITHTEAGR